MKLKQRVLAPPWRHFAIMLAILVITLSPFVKRVLGSNSSAYVIILIISVITFWIVQCVTVYTAAIFSQQWQENELVSSKPLWQQRIPLFRIIVKKRWTWHFIALLSSFGLAFATATFMHIDDGLGTRGYYWESSKGLLTFYNNHRFNYYSIMQTTLFYPVLISIIIAFAQLLVFHLTAMSLSIAIGITWQYQRGIVYRMVLGLLGLAICLILVDARSSNIFNSITRCYPSPMVKPNTPFNTLFLRIYESLLGISLSFFEGGAISTSTWLGPHANINYPEANTMVADIPISYSYPISFSPPLFVLRHALILLISAGLQIAVVIKLMIGIGNIRKKT